MDEADRMADMGFIDPVCHILDNCSKSRQTILFSATLDDDVSTLVKKYQKKPFKIEVGPKEVSMESMQHFFWLTSNTKKSKITIGSYNLDVNSRKIINNTIELKLTEKEINIIMFLRKHQKSISIKEMQSQVWRYNKDLETHTVETHIHRLKKKFKNVFKDENFIKSFNGGYKIN